MQTTAVKTLNINGAVFETVYGFFPYITAAINVIIILLKGFEPHNNVSNVLGHKTINLIYY